MKFMYTVTLILSLLLAQFLTPVAIYSYQNDISIDSLMVANPGEKIEARDSLLFLFTLNKWSDERWGSYAVRYDLYDIEKKDVSYNFIRNFYSPDRKKIITWFVEKSYNAFWRPVHGVGQRRMCPRSKDTVVSIGALIGIRNDTSEHWNVYPLGISDIVCCDLINLEKSIKEYYGVMNFLAKKNQYVVLKKNVDSSYGGEVYEHSGFDLENIVTQEMGYSLFEKDFWEKGLIWYKGAYLEGYYPFQIGNKTPLKMPKIIYPDSIINMYSKNHK